MERVRRFGTLMLLSLLGLALGACDGAGDRAAAPSAAAVEFEHMLGSHDDSGLCAALAPETRGELEKSEQADCARAIAAQDLPSGGVVRKVDVYGRQARVVLASDTLFLSRFPDGWKIVAAGCTPRPDRPYQCTVEGG